MLSLKCEWGNSYNPGIEIDDGEEERCCSRDAVDWVEWINLSKFRRSFCSKHSDIYFSRRMFYESFNEGELILIDKDEALMLIALE